MGSKKRRTEMPIYLWIAALLAIASLAPHGGIF
jgi:hypothetical protein